VLCGGWLANDSDKSWCHVGLFCRPWTEPWRAPETNPLSPGTLKRPCLARRFGWIELMASWDGRSGSLYWIMKNATAKRH